MCAQAVEMKDASRLRLVFSKRDGIRFGVVIALVYLGRWVVVQQLHFAAAARPIAVAGSLAFTALSWTWWRYPREDRKWLILFYAAVILTTISELW